MAIKNIRKVIGFICVGLAILLGLAGYSFMEGQAKSVSSKPQPQASVSPEEKARIQQAAIEEVQRKADILKKQQEEKEKQAAQKQGIDLTPIIAQARAQYDDAERNRKEGFLWVDRANKKYVVNLGAIHGLLPGSYLTIYQGAERVGQVTIDTMLDVISYVRPLDNNINFSASSYYRAVKE
jgi:hypothetical protein